MCSTMIIVILLLQSVSYQKSTSSSGLSGSVEKTDHREKHKHKKHKSKSKSKEKEKERARLEEMRRKRRQREEAERMRTEAMLRQHHGEVRKESTTSGPQMVEEMPGRYVGTTWSVATFEYSSTAAVLSDAD